MERKTPVKDAVFARFNIEPRKEEDEREICAQSVIDPHVKAREMVSFVEQRVK